MLELDRVAPFLVGRGLIDPSDVVAGDLSIVQADRRNRHFRVERRDRTGWFIKQPLDPAEGARESLRIEASFLQFCREEPRAAQVIPSLPRLVRREAGEDLLIYELIADAEPLGLLLDDPNDAAAGSEAAAGFGTALGTVHRTFDGIELDDAPSAVWLPRSIPWGLQLHEPGVGQLAHIGLAVREVLRIFQEGGVIGGHLDRLRRDWTPSTLIHGDVKFANVLARRPGALGGSSTTGPWIVDWEMVQHGDPAWDLAGALQDFLVLWAASMPMAEGLTADQRVARARIPLSALRPAIAGLWDGYRRGAGLGPAEAPGLLRRAVEFSGARLLQSAFEVAAAAEVLPGHAVILLQVAANLLADPGRGQVGLYGLPFIRAAA